MRKVFIAFVLFCSCIITSFSYAPKSAIAQPLHNFSYSTASPRNDSLATGMAQKTTISATTVFSGQSTTITTIFTNTTSSALNPTVSTIELYLNYSLKFQNYWYNENIPAHGSVTHSVTWVAPTQTGIYTIEVGTFTGPLWGTPVLWVSPGTILVSSPPTATPSWTPTMTATPSFTSTNTPTPTDTFSPTATPTATLTATDSPTATATDTPTNTATFTNTPTATIVPSNTSVPTDTATPSVTPTAPPNVVGYPHIANLDAFDSGSFALNYIDYGFIVGSSTSELGNPSPLVQLKTKNPLIKAIVYQDSSAITYMYDPDMPNIFPGWWLVLAGTTLSASINATTTSIPVVNSAPLVTSLTTNPDVLIDGETMHITSISGNTLTVQRGYYSTATTHTSGVRVAAHASNWPGAWNVNITPYCPKDSQNRTWNDFYVQRVQQHMHNGPWDGVFVDVSNSNIRTLDSGFVDANNDGIADKGDGPSGNGWAVGEAALITNLRTALPTAILVGNGGYYPGQNGSEFEHFPFYQGTWILGHQQYVLEAKNTTDVSSLNPDTSNTGVTNLQVMREGLATALMGNGYYSYDYGTQNHGQLWWFDEYDGGTGTSLTTAMTIGATLAQVAPGTGSTFHIGDIVKIAGDTFSTEQMQITAINNDTLSVVRGYNNSITQSHMLGSKVLTQAQLDSSTGWLDQPLSAPVQPSLTGTDLMNNSSFDSTIAPWNTSTSAPTTGTFSLDSTNPFSGTNSLKVNVTNLAQGAGTWDVNINQTGLHVVAGQEYTLTFESRAATPSRFFGVTVTQDTSPHTIYKSQGYVLSTTWNIHTFSFVAVQTETVRILFAFAQELGAVWIDHIHLFQGDYNFWRRDFVNGTVLLNESAYPQIITLNPGYYYIKGTQNPSLNSGAPVSSISIPANDAVILTTKAGLHHG